MSVAADPQSMSVEEFLDIAEDGISRELIRGQIRERGMTIHNRFHARATTKLARFLDEWLETLPEPRGEILTGEAGFHLRGTRDSLVGSDLAFVSATLMAATEAGKLIDDGPPIMAVEILSPSDTHRDIVEKIMLYLEAGVIVWVVDPDLRSVSVHKPGPISRTFYADDELTTEPELPGFRIQVSRIFGIVAGDIDSAR
jgi:Uma2 family endonuclease